MMSLKCLANARFLSRYNGRCISNQASPAAKTVPIYDADVKENETTETSVVGGKEVTDEKSYHEAKPFSEIPGPDGLPYLGTLLHYKFGRYNISKMKEVLQGFYHEHGKIVQQTIAGDTVLHLFDPDYIKHVYLQEDKSPYIAPLLETTQLYRQTRDLSPGLGNINGDEWKRLRSAVQQMMMRPKAVTVYLPSVNLVADDFLNLVKKLRDDRCLVPDFRNEIAKWQLESSAMTCFQTRLGCFEKEENEFFNIQKMIDSNNDIFVYGTKLRFNFPWYRYVSTPTWRKLVAAEDYFFGNGQKLVDATVDKIKSLVDENRLKDGDYSFLTYLMSRPELSHKDISIITLSLFGDGLNTTSPTLIWNLYALARYPEVQEKVFEEIQSVSPGGQDLTPDSINKMTYLKAFVKETFRFFPIGASLSRITKKDLVVGGFQVPKGVSVEFNNFVMFMEPKYFTNPEQFLPERWLRGGSGLDIHPYIMLPFGYGPRMCAGRRFAEQELYVLITKVLQQFKLEWQGTGDMGQHFQMLFIPDKPADIKFVDR